MNNFESLLVAFPAFKRALCGKYVRFSRLASRAESGFHICFAIGWTSEVSGGTHVLLAKHLNSRFSNSDADLPPLFDLSACLVPLCAASEYVLPVQQGEIALLGARLPLSLCIRSQLCQFGVLIDDR